MAQDVKTVLLGLRYGCIQTSFSNCDDDVILSRDRGSPPTTDCRKRVTVPWKYTVLSGAYYGVPYFERPLAVVTPYLTVFQTGVNSSVVENYGWSVAGALHK